MPNQFTQEVDLLIEGGVVITMNAERLIYNTGFVAVDGGKVAGTGSTSACPYVGRERIDATDMVILPGIVNAHDHLDQSIYRSLTDEKGSRNRLLKMARGLTGERARVAATFSLVELAHYGVTTTHENHWTNYHKDSADGVCEAVQDSGMRAVIFRGMSDKADYIPADFVEKIEDVIDHLDRLEKKYDSNHLRISSEPSTILRCTPEGVAAMRDWALKRDKIWHIHLAQTSDELTEALRTVGMGSVQYAESQGVLGPEMLAAHCSGILDEEVELLSKNRVRVAHCPVTQIRGGNKVPPIWKLEEQGAIVAIGTDGSATNNGQNPWEAMKMAIYMQRVQFNDRFLGTAQQALEMMTIKAAEALDMENRVGSLDDGKEADIALFRLDQLHLLPSKMLVNNLVYSGLSNMADTVLVGGKVILRGGRSTLIDEEEISARVCEVQEAMIKEAGFEGEIGLSSSWKVITN